MALSAALFGLTDGGLTEDWPSRPQLEANSTPVDSKETQCGRASMRKATFLTAAYLQLRGFKEVLAGGPIADWHSLTIFAIAKVFMHLQVDVVAHGFDMPVTEGDVP